MTNINDITGLGKFGEKFLDVCSSGIGAVYNDFREPKRIEKIGKIKNKINKDEIIKKAEGKAMAKSIKFKTDYQLQVKTEKRLVTQEIRRQKNIEKTILITSQNSDGKVSNNPVDEDWITRFFNIAQDINDEVMQIIFGKILADEIKRPNSYQKRTLDVLKNLEKEEAIILQEISSMVFYNKFIIKVGKYDLEEFNLEYNKILKLRSAGILQEGDNLTRYWENVKNVLSLNIEKQSILVKPKNKEKITLDILLFTNAGSEILKIIPKKENLKYIQAVKNFLVKQGHQAQIINS